MDNFDDGKLFALYKENYKSDIDLICDMRRLPIEAFLELYQSYDNYCNNVDFMEEDSNRFMFQFQYRFNEIIGKTQAV